MLLPTAATATTAATTFLQILINTHFSQLSSVLVVHDSRNSSALRLEYLRAVQQSFGSQSQLGNLIGLQWIDVGSLSDYNELEERLLRAVDIVTEGFITILPNTSAFLHARYYATRNAELRLKDKLYLFLCELEQPKDLLTAEILQFYPHHLMVAPAHRATATPPTGFVSSPDVSTQMDLLSQVAPAQQYKQMATATEITKNSLNKLPTRNKTLELPPLQSPTNVQAVVCLVDVQQQAIGEEAEPQQQYRDTNFELWTQKFVGATGNLDAVLLDAYLPNETFARHVELYPNKVLDLQGRTLRVGSITYIPYVVTNYVPTGMGNVDPVSALMPKATVFYVGSEAEIVKTFCHVHNCHLRVQPFGVDNWGVIYANETATGMLGDLYLQRVELAIGCIYNWYNELTETSHAIARSAVTLLGPAPAQFPAWRTPIMPFTIHLWLLLFATILLCGLVLYLIKLRTFQIKQQKKRRENWQQARKKKRFHHLKTLELAILDMIAIFIQQPSAPSILERFVSRLFIGTLLCATITLENAYSGQLKSILTIPFYTERVDTMDKWAQTDWKWAAPSIIWVQTIEESNLLNDQILTQKFEVRDYDFLYNASYRSDYGLGIERLVSGALNFGDFITADALYTKIVPKDDLYFDWTRAVSIRGWPLMSLFNEHILVCMETGLFVHWERKIVAQYLDRQTQDILLNLAMGHTVKTPPAKLTVVNVSGALFALVLGCLLATMVLSLEIFGNRLKMYFYKFEHKLVRKINDKVESFMDDAHISED